MRITAMNLSLLAAASIALSASYGYAEEAYFGVDQTDIVWQQISQTACLERGDAAIDGAIATFSLGEFDRRRGDVFGWYAIASNPFSQISVACIADDDTANLISDDAERVLVIVTLSGDLAADVRAFIVDCMASGACVDAAAAEAKPSDPPAVADAGPPPDAQAIRWIDSAEYLGYRDRVGERFLLYCSPTDDTDFAFSIYGTDIYTSDSEVCVAALHAGLITTAGGAFRLEPLPGQDSYIGTDRNGVASMGWGGYGYSFRLLAAKEP